MSERTTPHDHCTDRTDRTDRDDETNEVLFTWDGGDSHHCIEDGLDAFLGIGRARRSVRLPRAILESLLPARRG